MVSRVLPVPDACEGSESGREREREKERGKQREREKKRKKRECVCVRERERERDGDRGSEKKRDGMVDGEHGRARDIGPSRRGRLAGDGLSASPRPSPDFAHLSKKGFACPPEKVGSLFPRETPSIPPSMRRAPAWRRGVSASPLSLAPFPTPGAVGGEVDVALEPFMVALGAISRGLSLSTCFRVQGLGFGVEGSGV